MLPPSASNMHETPANCPSGFCLRQSKIIRDRFMKRLNSGVKHKIEASSLCKLRYSAVECSKSVDFDIRIFNFKDSCKKI